MDRNFERSLALVLKHEGGFVNHPADPGGATNKGITIATFRRYVKKNGTVADLKAITDAQVAFTYRKQYWDAVRGGDLPSGVDYAVFDFGVNSGPSRAIKFLQRVVGVEQDGMIGPATLRAVNAKNAADVIEGLCDARMKFLRGLGTWGTFGRGWTRRVVGVEDEALKMAKIVVPKPDVPKPVPPRPAPPSAPPAKPVNGGWVAALARMIAALFKRR